MRRLFFDAQQRLRNGWRALLFLALCLPAAALLAAAYENLLPRVLRPAVPPPLVVFLGVLLASWLCLRRERRPLSELGLALRPAGLRQALLGYGAGLVVVGGVALVAWGAGGYALQRVPEASLAALAEAAWTMVGVALLEEALFHGYPFQAAIRGLGTRWAQLLLAAIFVLAHPLSAELPGALKAFAMLNTLLAGLILGLCWVRTGSLWLSVGAHAGWNWAVGALGFGVSGNASKGWWAPVLHEGAEWLTGGSYGLEASPVSTLFLAGCLVLLVRWRGSAQAPASTGLTAPEPTSAHEEEAVHAVASLGPAA
jgi:membrane protease YdiL (CAAX protease family)